MKCYYLLLSILLLSSISAKSQCTIAADDYTVEIDITAIDLLTTQNGSTCNAQVVLEYDITISDGGPSWWNGDLYTLQGRLVCNDAAGSSFFDLPNGGGTGTVTSANFSYNNFDCEDVVLDCVVEIEASGPGLNYDDECGSVSIASLPVSFTKVYHKETNGTYSIHWQTATEINSAKYEVLQSTDGYEWTSVATTQSHNSRSGSSYEARVPHTASSYYRIVNIDFNGHKQLSETILVTSPDSGAPSIFPNPASEQVIITTGNTGDSELSIFDFTGRLVLQLEVSDQTSVDVSMMSPGTYSYRLSSSELQTTMGRLIKL